MPWCILSNQQHFLLRELEFQNTSGRAPRDLWCLDWASIYYEKELAEIRKNYPNDYAGVHPVYKQESAVESGHPTEIGTYVDAWGCVFKNIQRGVIGEVKQPIITDDEWKDLSRVVIPEEWLSFDVEQVNEEYRKTDKWITCGCCPRPFEQLQFMRGTVDLYMDLMDPPKGFLDFLEKMHDFY